jgi:hypothetical protein
MINAIAGMNYQDILIQKFFKLAEPDIKNN